MSDYWGPLRSVPPPPPPRIREIFISYHHDGDAAYYDSLSSKCAGAYQLVRDRSLRHSLESEIPEYVMRRIRENYIDGTSCTIVLCGYGTPWRKYVDWEIKATLDLQHGLVGVELPTVRPGNAPGNVLAPKRFVDNFESGYAVFIGWNSLSQIALRHAIEDALDRPKALIRNDRPLMPRNGTPPYP